MTTSQMGAERGEIWLVRFPFTDLSSSKARSAVVWAVFGEDAILKAQCWVSRDRDLEDLKGLSDVGRRGEQRICRMYGSKDTEAVAKRRRKLASSSGLG